MKFDEKTGILNIHIAGFHDAEEARRFVEDVLAEAQTARRKAGRLRVLSINEGETHVAPTDAVDEYRKLIQQLYVQPEDRGAYVVTSALARMQIARMGGEGRLKGFASVEDATQWLCE